MPGYTAAGGNIARLPCETRKNRRQQGAVTHIPGQMVFAEIDRRSTLHCPRLSGKGGLRPSVADTFFPASGFFWSPLEITDELIYALDLENGRPEHRKLLKAVRTFETYVRANRAFLPNYGERYRQGKTISTAFVESAVNQVVSKRFVKKQQMRWTPTGAHLLRKSASRC